MGYELDLSPNNLRFMYRRLIQMGYTPEQSGNLVAKLVGLALFKKGWTSKEIIDLLFLKTQIDKH